MFEAHCELTFYCYLFLVQPCTIMQQRITYTPHRQIDPHTHTATCLARDRAMRYVGTNTVWFLNARRISHMLQAVAYSSSGDTVVLSMQVRFGAKSGVAPMLLGVGKVCAGLLFGSSLFELLRLFPPPLLGVMLVLSGVELASTASKLPQDKAEWCASAPALRLCLQHVAF